MRDFLNFISVVSKLSCTSLEEFEVISKEICPRRILKFNRPRVDGPNFMMGSSQSIIEDLSSTIYKTQEWKVYYLYFTKETFNYVNDIFEIFCTFRSYLSSKL